ncbi:hypothetical protein [Mangrovibacterium lignilyticum]|uniref:hypothetical protein n=1 Tax=Mangrovibacterium lignilyticum TaxID=2668052 RepID=UPI0013D866D0|nr:hypothetical protein [Mangrovibacterium lignilyticum]
MTNPEGLLNRGDGFEQLVQTIRQRAENPHPLEPGGEFAAWSYTGWQYLYGEKEPISAITGIDCELLPANDTLDKKQLAILANELEKLLRVYHFVLDFPVNFPPHLRYEFIIRFWREEHLEFSSGDNHIDFCNYQGETACPFSGYCIVCTDVEVYLRSGQRWDHIRKYEKARLWARYTPSRKKRDGLVTQLQAALEAC